ncbi:hypothetical protein [Pseudoroseomonas sp. WGS1072]|uniref:hypothetical protein n=1 Tax=Roseomonas sp. WGS1072 TaxID=3366816 RepID=UPI003BF244E8
MTLRIRLLADDLAGTLETAARFTGAAGPVSCGWSTAALPEAAGLDARTRDRAPHLAAARFRAWAPTLAEGELAFHVLDARLRGSPAAEIAALFGSGPFRRVILVPDAGPGLQAVAGLRDALAGAGLPAALAMPGDPVPEGASLWLVRDAAELQQVVAAGRAIEGPVLWSGGLALAAALADLPPCPVRPVLPLLGLLGALHPMSTAQFAEASPMSMTLADNEKPERVQRRLERHGAAFLRLNLAATTSPGEAARRAELAFGALLRRLPPPATLLVSGGDTLRGLAGVLGAESLRVEGLIPQGLPFLRLRGGLLDGTGVIFQRSGVGQPGLLRELATAAEPPS